MALPNPGMSFSPFAILTAEEMNDLVENIESLADGTGFDAGAIGTEDVDDGAITPIKTSFTEYSTTEYETGKWIDGKTVYKKVINVGALANNGTTTTAHGISTIETLINAFGITTNATPTRLNVPFVSDLTSSSAAGNISMTITNTNVVIKSYNDKSGFTQTYVVLEYTKV